jgi:predicted DNA-binding protein (MmcQ/YjbR family)
MVSIEAFKNLALSLPEVSEAPHFEKTSFRINRKIFATLDEKQHIACVMLSLIDQSVFCAYDETIIYPVPNKWGQKGATFINLKKIRKTMLKDALQQSYDLVSAKKRRAGKR